MELSVQELVASAAPPPPSPVQIPLASGVGEWEGGGEQVRAAFCLGREYVFLNHGAFGAALRCGVDAAEAWRRRCEEQPLRFFDRELLVHGAHALRMLAERMHAAPQDVAVTVNATSALNAAIFGLCRELGAGSGGGAVAYLSIGYGSGKTMMNAAAKENGLRAVAITVPYPCDDVLGVITAGLRAIPDLKVLMVDSVTSNTAMALPIAEICLVAHALGAVVIVDAAHSLGTVDINVPELGCDVWISNGHKWLCAPKVSPPSPAPTHCRKGVAVMWRKPGINFRAAVLSHGHGHGLASEFLWSANRVRPE